MIVYCLYVLEIGCANLEGIFYGLQDAREYANKKFKLDPRWQPMQDMYELECGMKTLAIYPHKIQGEEPRDGY